MKRFHDWYWQIGVVLAFVGSPFCFKGINEITIAFLIVYTIFVAVGLDIVYHVKRDLFGWFLLKEFVVISIAAFYGYLFCYHPPYCWLSIIVACLLLIPVNSQIEKRLK